MDFENLHQILRSLYDEMIPLCSDMTDIAKGLAGLGALFYVALRVWQSLSRAEPIDVFPLLRPFAIGLAIMFFPTIVLGTLNSVMSPIVQGTHSMLETQTFDMNEYRAQKDKLEYEAMKRNPETAYLVSNEEFDKQLDELGWSPGDVVTMAGMYVERGMYSMKKSIRDFFRELLELLFQAAALVIDVLRTFFLPHRPVHPRTALFRHIGMGRIPVHADAMVLQVHTDLSLATRFGLVQYHPCQDTGADAAKRHRGIAERPEFFH